MTDLTGKVAVVTGAAMGMGWGAAQALAEAGAFVNLVDISEQVFLAKAQICQAGGQAEAYQLDVRDLPGLNTTYAAIQAKLGSLDILVNAAGLGSQKYFPDLDYAYVENYFNVNFKGVWNSCQAAVKHMQAQRYGKIVNFASVTGIKVVDPGMTSYAATKGAVLAFTKALAVELAPDQITCNAILPGMIDTPMTDASCREANPKDPDAVKQAIAANIPLGRMGTVAEAGKVALFLASDDSSYVTGIGLVFDGGSTLPENPGAGWQPPVS